MWLGGGVTQNENMLQSAFDRYATRVDEIAGTRDWSAFADMFTEDATYREHAYGDFNGREEIRTWVVRTMNEFPATEMIAFPAAWSVVDPATNRVICDIRNVMRDPGDGSVHEASNITILTFDDDGNLIREEDIYNPQKFADMTRDWCRVAEAHGTLSDAGRKMLSALGG